MTKTYWYHPESESFFTTGIEDHAKECAESGCIELSRDEYYNSQLQQLDSRRRELLAMRAADEAKGGAYRCTVCKESFVSPEDGQDTCDFCIANS